MSEYVWIDLSIIKCPHCGKIYSDASWYVLDMESDIQCTKCGRIFNTKRNLIDRVLIKLVIKNNKVENVILDKHLPLD